MEKLGTSKPQRARQAKTAEEIARLQKKLLDSVKDGKIGRQTGIWLKNLSDEAKKPAHNELDLAQARSRQYRTMTVWVERLFDLFHMYASKYNRMVEGSEFVISIERPSPWCEWYAAWTGRDMRSSFSQAG